MHFFGFGLLVGQNNQLEHTTVDSWDLHRFNKQVINQDNNWQNGRQKQSLPAALNTFIMCETIWQHCFLTQDLNNYSNNIQQNITALGWNKKILSTLKLAQRTKQYYSRSLTHVNNHVRTQWLFYVHEVSPHFHHYHIYKLDLSLASSHSQDGGCPMRTLQAVLHIRHTHFSTPSTSIATSINPAGL